MNHFSTQQYYDPASTRWIDFDFAFLDHVPYASNPPSELTVAGVSGSSQHGRGLQSGPHLGASQCTDNDRKAFLDLGTGPGFDLSRCVSDLGPESDLSFNSYRCLDPDDAKSRIDMNIGVDLDPCWPDFWIYTCQNQMTFQPPTSVTDVPSLYPGIGDSSTNQHRGLRYPLRMANPMLFDLQFSSGQQNAHGQAGKEQEQEPSSSLSVSHMEMSRYLCGFPGCGKTFKRKEHHKRHYETLHGKRKRLRCEVCGRDTFARMDNLNAHLRLHAKKRINRL